MVAEIAKTVFGAIWKMFVNTQVPGLNVSFAALAIALFIIRFSISLFGLISGIGGMGSADYGRAANNAEKLKNSYRWNNRNKIGF